MIKIFFLEIFSPWHKKEGKDLIEGFVNNVKDDNSTNNFSWLDILNADERWKKSGNDKEIKEIYEYALSNSNPFS